MNNMKKLASILLALVMVFTMTTFAFAVDSGKGGEATIIINAPDDLAADEVATYKIYKVFDATVVDGNINYTLVDTKSTTPAGFVSDDARNVYYGTKDANGAITIVDKATLDATDIAAIKDYVGESDLVYTAEVTGPNSVDVTGLPYGYYYIETNTGSAVAVDSTKPIATVTDKNIVPELDKTITSVTGDIVDGSENETAIAQVGTEVEFKVEIAVGSGTSEYIFHDTLSSGLTLKAGSLNVTVNGTPATYTETKFANEEDNAVEDIILTFTEDYLKTVDNETIVITYTATINDKALTTDSEKNSAWLEYGNDPGDEGKPSTPKDETTVYDATISVTKKDGEGDALAGAGFILKNGEDKYYKLDNGVVTWVDEADADVHTSVADGTVPAFTGLANGDYTLIEKLVPNGYNKADDVEFTIAENDVTDVNLKQSTEVINLQGSTLPSTGGIGTTIFYVSGAVLAIAAVVFLVTKKRMSGEEE